MNVHLQRQASTPDGTLGRLVGMDFEFPTIERPWVDANGDGIGDPQTSCITPGTYQCVWHESPAHGWCYEITGVKGRSHILIHPANRAEQLLGCIALGKNAGVMPDSRGRAVLAVLQSKLAIKEFHAAMREQPFTLTIEAAK